MAEADIVGDRPVDDGAGEGGGLADQRDPAGRGDEPEGRGVQAETGQHHAVGMRAQNADAGGFRHGAEARDIREDDGAARAVRGMAGQSRFDLGAVIGHQSEIGIVQLFALQPERARKLPAQIGGDFLAERCSAPA